MSGRPAPPRARGAAGRPAPGGRNAPGHLAKHRHRRLRLLGAGIVVAVVGLVVRLVVVQVLDGSAYAAYSASEVHTTVSLPATRGAIYDRSGQLVAISEPAYDVIADDFLVTSPSAAAASLAPALHRSAAALEPLLAERNGYVVLAHQVSGSEEARIAGLDLPSVTFVTDDRRVYVDPSLYEPIVGGVDAAGRGTGALESEYDGVLRGRAGSEVLAQSAAGDALPGAAGHVVAPRQGTGLVLTIDSALQEEVTKEVTAEMRATGAHSGVAVFEDVHTGDILAMVDLTRGARGAIVPAPSNLAVTAIYQPGSVMKLATFSFSLQDHLISPGTVFSVPDQLAIGGYDFQDAEVHPTMAMTASQILAQSSNVGTIKVSRLLGPQRLYKAFHALGFGKFTGLGWPGESPGILGTPATWYGSSLGSVPIGTGVAVTPLQILDAYNTVANGGVFVEPRLVAGTIGASGTEKRAAPTPSRRVLEKSTVSDLVPMLEGVIQDGTAVCAAVPGYTVAGKTGTAQVVNANGTGYVANDWNATFVGFVPAQAPQLSGIVWLDHPQPIYGGSVSAPVFGKVMSWALRHYDLPAPPGVDTQSQVVPSTCNGA